jgi:hypothetical protein
MTFRGVAAAIVRLQAFYKLHSHGGPLEAPPAGGTACVGRWAVLPLEMVPGELASQARRYDGA